jgi:biotin transport system substrate-specific component
MAKENHMAAVNTITISELLNTRSRVVSVQAFWILTFALLTAIGARIEIPHTPVPFTLQTLFVLLAGATLGARNGAVSMSAYLAAGLMGLPVFSGGGFGVGRILGPTGGYLLAFPLAAALIGSLLERGSGLLRIITAMLLGLLIIFSLGTLQLKIVTGMDWNSALAGGFLIFSWWDVLKLAAAAGIYRTLSGGFFRSP